MCPCGGAGRRVLFAHPHTAGAADADVDLAWHGGAPFRLGTQQYVVPVAQLVDTDGSTCVVGNGTSLGFAGGLVTKLDPNGNLDSSFGGTGGLHDSNMDHYLNDVGGAAVPGDGLIIVGHVQTDWVAIRIDQSGSIDQSFGSTPRRLKGCSWSWVRVTAVGGWCVDKRVNHRDGRR